MYIAQAQLFPFSPCLNPPKRFHTALPRCNLSQHSLLDVSPSLWGKRSDLGLLPLKNLNPPLAHNHVFKQLHLVSKGSSSREVRRGPAQPFPVSVLIHRDYFSLSALRFVVCLSSGDNFSSLSFFFFSFTHSGTQCEGEFLWKVVFSFLSPR